MAPSAPQTFHGVSPARFEMLAQKARSAGIPLEGNSGTASKFGIEVQWNYSPETQELTIQCLSTPFFLKSADVDARIRNLVQETQTA